MYPKVLILEESFHKQSGSGITLYNLFNQWPSESLMVAANNKLIIKNDFDKCNTLYALGRNEIIYKFPLKLLKKNSASGIITDSKTIPSRISSPKKRKQILLSIKQIALKILDKFGLIYYCEQYRLSAQFQNWLQEQKPDLIYTRLGSLAMMKFVYEIHSKLKIPFVIHIMDDWPKTIVKTLILKKYWNNRIDNLFRLLIENAAGLFAISAGMQKEYGQRYNKDFFPFHNPIEVQSWDFSQKSYLLSNPIKIIYVGRLGIANSKSIREFAGIINDLNSTKLNIEFNIYTSDYTSALAKKCVRFKGVHVFAPVTHNKIPLLLNEADILLLPLDNDKHSIKYARLSFPTKASEYMISGTPIIIFAPENMYLCQHALLHKWAIIAHKKCQLKEQIEKLISNMEFRKELGERARNFAIQNFNEEKIQALFKEKMLEAYQKNNYF